MDSILFSHGRKSNADGTICFGDVDEDNVKNACSLTNNYDPRHYIKMGSTGARKGRTTCEAPQWDASQTGARS